MTLLSTAYFPPVSWLAIAYQQKEIAIDLWETYPRQSYRNRCNIATSTGSMSLSIPVNKPSGNQSKTQEITLDDQQKWQQQHWRSIKNAYESSPFFIYYESEIKDLIFSQRKQLWELNELILVKLAELIDFQLYINYTSDFITPDSSPTDYRFAIHPKDETPLSLPAYYQVFNDKLGFIDHLSSLDLLFNMGPESLLYLDKLPIISVQNNKLQYFAY